MSNVAHSAGDRSVANTASVTGSTIITGDHNIAYQHAVPRVVEAATLRDAEALLAALPVDAAVPVPPPARALPSGSRMKHLRPNPLFVGRDADLRALAKALKDSTSTHPIAITTGSGGIGKTQLAIEVAHRYGPFFAGGVFWVSCETAAGLPTEIASCGGVGALNLRADFGALALDEQLALVSAAWQSALPRLLIFDNCEDETLLAAWRPPSGGCRVLVTTRRAHWSATLSVTPLPLDVLSRAESVALLRKHRPDLRDDDPDLALIAAELGDLPLALHLAGSYLARYQYVVTPAAYLARLRSPALLQHPSMQQGAWSPTGHDLHVGRTFALNYDQLTPTEPTDALARKLLARAAYFAPGEPIPRDVLRDTLHPAPASTREPLEDALSRLIELGLLEQAGSAALRLHRLLSVFVQTVASDAEAQADVEQALIDRTYALATQGLPAPLLPLHSHLRHITDVALTRVDERAATLANNFGHALQMSGDSVGAYPYYERAIAMYEQVRGPLHPHTASSLNNLGALLRARGDLAAARPYYERALAIKEQVLGPLHPHTAQSLNNLGTLLWAQGDVAAARRYVERALAIYEQVQGPLHPDTARNLNTLGMLLQTQGELAAARGYVERGLAIREQVLGPLHPDTALSLNNLGNLLQAQGELTAARPYVERALAIREQVLGPLHPDTAQSLNNLGALLQVQGDLAAARPSLERALAIREQVLGPLHPDTAQSLNNLGLLLLAQGDLAAARPYLERALAISMAQLGADHPTTQQIRRNLGTLNVE